MLLIEFTASLLRFDLDFQFMEASMKEFLCNCIHESAISVTMSKCRLV